MAATDPALRSLQRSRTSSGKLRFGKDKLFRTASDSNDRQNPRLPLQHSSASAESVSSSEGVTNSWTHKADADEPTAAVRIELTESSDRPSENAASQRTAPAAAGTFRSPTGPCRSLSDLEILATIGIGTFGRVKLVRDRNDGQHYALKVLRKEQLLRLKQVQHVLNERRLLAAVDHPLVVKMYGTFQDEARLYMLMEYIPGGELFAHMRAAGRFPPNAARFYTACVVSALDHLHSHDIVYRDLKPENLLIAPSGYVKLCDFGFAKRLAPGPRARTFTLCGTSEYLAPELVSNAGHSKGVDWWAVGVLLFEMLAGYPPFQDGNTFAVFCAVLSGRLTFPQHFDPGARDLVRALLLRDVGGRLGCGVDGGAAVKAHPFFASIDWAALHAGTLKPPFVPILDHEGDRRHFGWITPSTDGGGGDVGIADTEAVDYALAGKSAFREF